MSLITHSNDAWLLIRYDRDRVSGPDGKAVAQNENPVVFSLQFLQCHTRARVLLSRTLDFAPSVKCYSFSNTLVAAARTLILSDSKAASWNASVLSSQQGVPVEKARDCMASTRVVLQLRLASGLPSGGRRLRELKKRIIKTMKANIATGEKWSYLTRDVLAFLRTGFEDDITMPELTEYARGVRNDQKEILAREQFAGTDQRDEFARWDKVLETLLPDPEREVPYAAEITKALKTNNVNLTARQAMNHIQSRRYRYQPAKLNTPMERRKPRLGSTAKPENQDAYVRLRKLLDEEMMPPGAPRPEPGKLRQRCQKLGINLSNEELSMTTRERERKDPLRDGQPPTIFTTGGVHAGKAVKNTRAKNAEDRSEFAHRSLFACTLR